MSGSISNSTWVASHCVAPSFRLSYTIILIYYAFCLVLMMLLRPLLVKKIACGLGKSDRFKSIYAALYFFPILTVLQAVGGGLLCEFRLPTAFPPRVSTATAALTRADLLFFRLRVPLHHTGFVTGHAGCVHVCLRNTGEDTSSPGERG